MFYLSEIKILEILLLDHLVITFFYHHTQESITN